MSSSQDSRRPRPGTDVRPSQDARLQHTDRRVGWTRRTRRPSRTARRCRPHGPAPFLLPERHAERTLRQGSSAPDRTRRTTDNTTDTSESKGYTPHYRRGRREGRAGARRRLRWQRIRTWQRTRQSRGTDRAAPQQPRDRGNHRPRSETRGPNRRQPRRRRSARGHDGILRSTQPRNISPGSARHNSRDGARRDDIERVHKGLRAAHEVGFQNTKIDTVAIRGVNDGEFGDLISYARSINAEVRFIEYMDVGGATRWRMDRVVSRARILEILSAKFGSIRELPRTDAAPADRFELADGTTFGIISSVTQPFCATCDRARLTADGMWFTCLYAQTGTDLRQLIRGGASDEALHAKLIEVWAGRQDRGAEVRAGMHERAPLAEQANLRENPHLEMHTRGG